MYIEEFFRQRCTKPAEKEENRHEIREHKGGTAGASSYQDRELHLKKPQRAEKV